MRTARALLCALLAAGACSTNPATGEKQLSLISREQEIQIGQQGAQEVEQTIGLVDDAQAQRYVAAVGKKLAARIVLELKEKVSAAGAGALGGGPAGSSESEVAAALQALGYTTSEAREAARGAVAALPVGSSLEERVKAALRVLRRD